ncbi:hypothetical protein Scani_41240 [Streptomyces caniferus]|uniref:Uncharacterized protein n=1 Tax=Streptomyces caniferus TaxID=285557 RepID=A0A640SBH5_9ACTN|nr:hypothetical protein Scani_41240 [Streptomyces caniferus]
MALTVALSPAADEAVAVGAPTARTAVMTAEANRVRAVRMGMFLSAYCEGRHSVGLLIAVGPYDPQSAVLSRRTT